MVSTTSLIFFFSSRRRHTRWPRDWSSDVCSSDLKEYSANHIIIATGAQSRVLPSLKQDGKKIIGYREAMSLKEQPKSMIVVGKIGRASCREREWMSAGAGGVRRQEQRSRRRGVRE